MDLDEASQGCQARRMALKMGYERQAVPKEMPAGAARFLMCPPTLYEVDYVINPWMEGNIHASDRGRAERQWRELYGVVSALAEVELVQPQPGSPDMVFTANAGLERDGIVVLSSFRHPERQGEEEHFREWFAETGYEVVVVPRELPFEGEGDALFSRCGTRLWAGWGQRTCLESHAILRAVWPIEVVPLCLVDPRFYHLDTCFAPLSDGYVMYYPAAFDAESLGQIEAFCPEAKRIVVDEADALCFACNAVNVGRTVILNRVSKGLKGQLQRHGFAVEMLDLSEFLKAGGAAKCLVMRLGSGLD